MAVGTERWKPAAVFLFTLILCASVQGWAWNREWILDQDAWFSATLDAAHNVLPAEGDFLYGYPATTILLSAGALTNIFGDEGIAFRSVMTAFLALAASFASLLAYYLRPKSLWWIFIGWIYAFQPMFILSTPPAALCAALGGVFILLALFAAKQEHIRSVSLLTLGVLGGILLATRIDISFLFIGAITLYLSTRRLAALYLIPLGAVATFAVLDPTLWSSGPVEHLGGVFAKILFLAETSGLETAHPFVTLQAASPFGFVAFLLGMVLACIGRLRALPNRLFICLAILTFITLAALLAIQHQPVWMFFMLLFPWELFLPLLIVDVYEALPEQGILRKITPRTTFFLVVGSAYVMYHLGYFFFEIS